MFESLKEGLAAPLSGMGISFSSSLFGLAGSLVLGFLDLQTSQAQNRFYTDLEDWLSTTVRDLGVEPDAQRADRGPVANEMRLVVERLKEVATEGGSNQRRHQRHGQPRRSDPGARAAICAASSR